MSDEEARLVGMGWQLVGVAVAIGDVRVVTATSNLDGMCRPMGYQTFVFADGLFAGTISPEPMNARSTGAGEVVSLSHDRVEARFLRYAQSDPLCCPTFGPVVVVYEIVRDAQEPVLLPTQRREEPPLVGEAVPPRDGAPPSDGCRLQLGFAALHDLIPSIVGNCVENEHYHPATGDALQRTTNGLLVWRKADNWTAFTNGARTWVNGPLGLQERSNGERFSWEANPEGLPIVPAPTPGDRCHTAGLDLEVLGTDAGAGNVVATLRWTNRLAVSCTFFGYPGAQLLDEDGTALPTEVVRGGGYFAGNPGPSLVHVAPGESAVFRLHWGQVQVGDEAACPTASSLAVIPPDEYAPLVVPIFVRACGGGRLNVSAVEAPNAH